ncbi:Kae1-associated kinase Bud32 [Candidatus Nitrosopelagicus brevis]|uniref:non-specific serine/threonine protein kinase n=1 Tax=Candidatus Nitrosopelagicus brevis TaxID=1410606 RepID=A0A0A7UZH9_9ARCH|nr:KEOPS complex kinase/ATPase Bud32 [Candidatus Nitrosopelagicus brevis]AJA92023.1 Kae1-associated kinase Bud32 [Candidatus Nitrosopelagicus brevis]PTL87475.1 Kae1-associated kinase Bud32 [Candidatus Nitrosopelagicus brevis]
MKILKKGAEADVYLSSWNGKKSVLKIRKEKKYRNPRLDERIRKQRTIREAQLISDVKSFGISTPLIHFVDYKKFSIYMQYVNGKLIRDMDDKSIPKVCLQIGKIVGNLHKNGIMHGDLTTSNFILTQKNLFLIDFGLANRTEKPDDHAVDLRLFKEILNSAHANVMEKSWKNFVSGYQSSVGKKQCSKILELVAVIESRGRYATVV